MAKIIGIYKITSPTGKIYIGQSWDVQRRIWQHRKSKERSGEFIKRSLLKHGPDKHTFEIIHELPFDVDQSVLDIYECLYISQYKSLGFEMLNLTDGGKGGKHSEFSKKKMSEVRKDLVK